MSFASSFKKNSINLAVTAALSTSVSALADESLETNNQNKNNNKPKSLEVIQITATRRTGSIQDLPINVSAIDADLIEKQNLTELSDIARWVPGLSIADQGGRSDQPIILRGLNTNSSGPGANAETVATYLGETPLLIDLKPLDLQRVEVLIGPQGTLYGAGTLGGAIRYIPNKPEMDTLDGSAYFDVSRFVSDAPSTELGSDAGFVINVPLINDTLALRTAFAYTEAPGYVDYAYTVKKPGVSLPDVDWSDAAQVSEHTQSIRGANTEETLTARASLRWLPTDKVDATLSVHFQKQDIGGRSIVHRQGLADDHGLASTIGEYESAYRVAEPLEREDLLTNLDVIADLGFAELTSSTAISASDSTGARDQTDLLVRLDYGYEEFPALTAFTRENADTDIFTQELRLVSTSDSNLTWIAGAFYYNKDLSATSKEFTPNFDLFAINEWGVTGAPRPDALEYFSANEEKKKESALFGEISYQITHDFSATLGVRLYRYNLKTKAQVDYPLLYTTIDPDNDGRAPHENLINLANKEWEQAKNSGSLFKINLSYDLTDDALTYFTISEGYRIGGSNVVPSCDDPVIKKQQEKGLQVTCATDDEMQFEPDTTTNYELGFKSTWLRNRFHLNAALFYVDWQDAQIGGATASGQQPITSNAGGAKSRGFELAGRGLITDELSLYATFAFTEAELKDDAPYLFNVATDETQDWYDGKAGDRLPGAPKYQYSLGGQYSTDLNSALMLDVNFGYTGQGNVYSKVGIRADGEKLPSYALANISARVSSDVWGVTFYIDNLFDTYAYTGVRRDKGDIGEARYSDFNSHGSEIQRNYGHFLVKPRMMGIKFDYQFDSF
ncbi:TonB-dependent receptor [Algibacillus agarilyticus]|uniref:TonB-dependent receptor n=1 Tax=Algibacillus agarilyticus TaxID=2234133 RepID=UPI000DCFBAF5|nr:TonB-dependent receptor [Algibacillus agarilyticus]